MDAEEDLNLLVINKVKDYPDLYKNQTSIPKRKIIWKEIADSLKFERDIMAISRWHCVFHKYATLIQENNDEELQKFPYKKEMDFFRPYIKIPKIDEAKKLAAKKSLEEKGYEYVITRADLDSIPDRESEADFIVINESASESEPSPEKKIKTEPTKETKQKPNNEEKESAKLKAMNTEEKRTETKSGPVKKEVDKNIKILKVAATPENKKKVQELKDVKPIFIPPSSITKQTVRSSRNENRKPTRKVMIVKREDLAASQAKESSIPTKQVVQVISKNNDDEESVTSSNLEKHTPSAEISRNDLQTETNKEDKKSVERTPVSEPEIQSSETPTYCAKQSRCEDEIFGELVVAMLRKLPPERKRTIKKDIMNMLL